MKILHLYILDDRSFKHPLFMTPQSSVAAKREQRTLAAASAAMPEGGGVWVVGGGQVEGVWRAGGGSEADGRRGGGPQVTGINREKRSPLASPTHTVDLIRPSCLKTPMFCRYLQPEEAPTFHQECPKTTSRTEALGA